jgi:hypothetical protein
MMSPRHTYISEAIGSKAPLDLTFVDQRSALLYTWKVGKYPWNSDQFPISIAYNGVIEARKGRKKASRLHNKNTDWTAFMKKCQGKSRRRKNV